MDDPKEVAACDAQVAREMARAAQRDRQRFSSVMWMRRQEAQAQARASTAPAASERFTEHTQRVERTWASSQQLQEERRRALEQKLADKELRAAQRTGLLSTSRTTSALSLATASSQQLQAAQERAQELADMRAAVMQHDHAQRAALRQEREQRRRAEAQQRVEDFTRSSMHVRATAAQRKELKDEQDRAKFASKAAAVMSAAEQAERKRQQMLAAQAQRIAASRQQREQVLAEKQVEHEQLAMGRYALYTQKHAAREARVAQRVAEARQREQVVNSKNMADMLAKCWAAEYEYRATCTNKLPTVAPEVEQSLRRLQAAV